MSDGLLHLEVVLKKANRKADDSVVVSFETISELDNEQFAFVDSFRKQVGHLVFKRDGIQATDIPKSDVGEAGETPSQALRRSLYAVWKAKMELGKVHEDWDTYYANAMMGFKRAVDKSHPAND